MTKMYFLRDLKVGQKFILCRTGEKFELISAYPETPHGFRRNCKSLSEQNCLVSLNHGCHVLLIGNVDHEQKTI